MFHDRSRWPELGILMIGLLLSVGLAWQVWSWNDRQRAMQVRQGVEIYAQVLLEGLVKLIEDAQVLAQFYGASDAVRGDEFARFTRPLLQRHPMLHALEWAPRVPGRERDAFESAARVEGFQDFAIREQVTGHWRPAGARPEYFPVWRIEPQTGNEPALGFDLASEPLRRAALQQACESGWPVASAPVTLVLGAANQRGLIVLVPQYTPDREAKSAADRCASLRGVAIVVLRLGDLVEAALNPLPVQGLDFILLDAELAGEEGVLHVHPSHTRTADAKPNPTALVHDPRGYAVTIPVAGRQWVLRGVPADRNSQRAAMPILLFFLGLTVTAVLTTLAWNRRNAVWRLRASEAELSRTSNTLRAALEAMADAVFISDAQGQVILFNSAFSTFHKFPNKQTCGKSLVEYAAILDVYLPDGGGVPLEQWTVPRALRGETVSEAEYGLYRKDTGERWVGSYNFAPIRDSKGQIIGSVVTARDITKRKQLEVDIREAQRTLEQEQKHLEKRVAVRTAELQRSEAKLRTIFDLAPVGISITDPHGHIFDCNRAAETILGLTRAAHLARNFDGPEWRILRPDGSLMPAGEYASVRALAEQCLVRDLEMGIETPEGIRWILVSAVPSPHPDYGVIIVYVDISERKRAETLRQAAETALRDTLAEIQRHDAHMTALNRMNHLLLACDTRDEAYQIVTRAAGQLFDACPGALAILDDEDPTRLRTVAAWGGTGPLSAEFDLTQCWALRRGEVHEVADATTGAQCHHFEHPPTSGYLCLPLNMRGQIRGLLHVGAPIVQTEVQRREWRTLAVAVSEVVKLALSNIELRERLHALALRDPLTGLFNRRHLEDTLPRLLMRGQHQGEPMAVAMLDVDHFKGFNDTYGHEAGDAVLRALGALLRDWVRAGDLACRYGGEELTLVMPGCPQEVAHTRLDGLREAIRALRVSAQGQDLPQVTVSIGLAVSTGSESSSAPLLARADAALYRAKAGGRNRVVVDSASDPSPTDAVVLPAASPSNDPE